MHSVIHEESLKPAGIYSISRDKSDVAVEAFEGVLDGMPVYFINGDPIRASEWQAIARSSGAPCFSTSSTSSARWSR